MKALVLLAYYERPVMVKGALESLRRQPEGSWRAVMVDDGSKAHGQAVVEAEFSDLLPNFSFVRIEDSISRKVWQGGSRHPHYINEAILAAKEDLVVILCDDDALVPGILDPLLRWHAAWPAQKWSYGHVSVYDPGRESVPWMENHEPRRLDFHLNRRTDPILPAYIVDSSQVVFTRSAFTEETMFPPVNTKNCDAAIFEAMGKKWGRCPFNGLVLQMKGIHKKQMGRVKETAIYTETRET